MARTLYALFALFIGLVAFVTYLFIVQNSARSTQLSLNLGFAAWQLAAPLPVPVLIALAFGTGLLLGTFFFGIRSIRLASRVRRLEQEIALSANYNSPSYNSPQGGAEKSDWR